MPVNSPLDTYRTNYLNGPGCSDVLRPVFRRVRDQFHVQRVLYPGSYLHITPSLCFPYVCYVDSLAGIADALASPDLRRYVAEHRDYPEAPETWCYQQDYRTFTSEPEASFDLLISLNAGLISQACKHFLAPDGLLLVNDEHYDARRAFVDPDYLLIAVFVGENLSMETSESMRPPTSRLPGERRLRRTWWSPMRTGRRAGRDSNRSSRHPSTFSGDYSRRNARKPLTSARDSDQVSEGATRIQNTGTNRHLLASDHRGDHVERR